jgi:hypothetical protein
LPKRFETKAEANAIPAAIRGKAKSSAKGAIHQHQERLDKWRTGAKDEQHKHNQPIPSTFLQTNVERVLNELVNGVEADLFGKKKLSATREHVVQGWLATETALREQGLNKEADQVVEFIQKLTPVKTDHDVLKDQMLADQVRLQAALAIKTPTVANVVTPGDDLTPVR